MMKENAPKASGAMGRLNLTDKDVARITNWIEDDGVSQDMYNERLDEILGLGAQSDKDALAHAGLTSTGQEVMNLWNDLDRGAIQQDEAFQEADKAVRRKNQSMEKNL